MKEYEYKGYRVVPLGTFSLYSIMPRASGTIPNDLHGHYTTLTEANRAIDRYLASLVGRGRKKDVKEASTSSN